MAEEPGLGGALQITTPCLGKDIEHATVLNETQIVDEIETRVVDEEELHDGKLAEHSRNCSALCNRTNSVFYFGDDVLLRLREIRDSIRCKTHP